MLLMVPPVLIAHALSTVAHVPGVVSSAAVQVWPSVHLSPVSAPHKHLLGMLVNWVAPSVCEHGFLSQRAGTPSAVTEMSQ
jgi:hypothetical protein